MPGQPLRRRVTEALAARAVQAIGDDASVIDYGVEWIASARSVQALADSLAAELQTSVSRPLVSSILHTAAPDASERLDAARREGAYALVEEATQIADACEPTAGAAAAARLRTNIRTWQAGKFNSIFSEKSTATVNINVGALMLEALRQPIETLNVPEAPALIPSEAAPAEYEIAE
jgi:hypothetical protein